MYFIVIRPELSHIKGQNEREVALRQEQPYGYEYKVRENVSKNFIHTFGKDQTLAVEKM